MSIPHRTNLDPAWTRTFSLEARNSVQKRHIGHIGRGTLATFQASASAFSLQDTVVSYHPGFPAIMLLNPEAMYGHSLRKTDEKVGNLKLELSDCACFSVSEE